MKPQYLRLYENMLKDIEKCKGIERPEIDTIEACYKCTINYLEQLYKHYRLIGFKTEQDEIFFFKSIKPTFAGQVELYITLNHALLFTPIYGIELKLNFWEHEKIKIEKFYKANERFIYYFKSGRTDMDSLYFLTKNSNNRINWPTKVYTMQPEMSTSYDHILATMVAYEVYTDYINEAMEKISINS